MNLPNTRVSFDLIIVGAGPAGLSFARSMADTGLQIALIERLDEAAIADPAFDGREIALTQTSIEHLRQLGIWKHIDADAISPLRDAAVENGRGRSLLQIDHRMGTHDELGMLVANHQIRRAAYRAVREQTNVSWFTGAAVSAVDCGETRARVRLDDNRLLDAALVVAVDSRFSETRRMLGIPARSVDFGKTMLVCNMEHTEPHAHVARECFEFGYTAALLPRNGNSSSVVITQRGEDISRLMAMDETEFARTIEHLLRHRLGTMQLRSTRHAYPLVAVYADRFVARRYAVIGDAAVGMHPVTAHGFNFGLSGQALLAEEIRNSLRTGRDIGNAEGLARYQSRHRRATLPLYLTTNAIAKLFTDDRLPARFARDTALRVAERLSPFKRAVVGTLTRGSARSVLPRIRPAS
ncbi:5-demethoxyubiquinol-8 5-hydroxylase UbiM [Sinimarinibacterium sp. CAU 1509]|uniref:5-demethoxyubiquinol-8 5-hydroxylase UbiM n=1 Tax=Sinimarinibacterium sp. CAU 1509 TaxID=2562283 RepID=UPI0010AC1B95|nr:5-demethoxyubiquinol-8 5-hydroxylase UbiM [Sinimarinibacterium sp. CAU 1509]TJY59322.1 5-demethoxyubiquinol-8 5-hydroxylase UbiM [Sinimarinibacterium sp. CAU 1509]